MFKATIPQIRKMVFIASFSAVIFMMLASLIFFMTPSKDFGVISEAKLYAAYYSVCEGMKQAEVMDRFQYFRVAKSASSAYANYRSGNTDCFPDGYTGNIYVFHDMMHSAYDSDIAVLTFDKGVLKSKDFIVD